LVAPGIPRKKSWLVPVYRGLKNDKHILQQDPQFAEEDALKMYKNMIQLNEYDRVMYDAQRQGRISFYMTNYGHLGLIKNSSLAN